MTTALPSTQHNNYFDQDSFSTSNNSFSNVMIPTTTTTTKKSTLEDDCNVRVALRARPLSNKELNERAEEVIRYIDGEPQVAIGKDQTFTFDYVFNGRSKQQDIFESCVYQLVESLFQGYNSTILAYGQTGSGKTFTMGSATTVGIEPEDLGVIPRVIDLVFDKVEKIKSTHQVVVRVSFLELYNEEVRDMLNPDPTPGGLPIRENANGEIYIPGLVEEVVRTRNQMEDALIRGSNSQQTALKKRGGKNVNNDDDNEDDDEDEEEDYMSSDEKNPTIRSQFHFVDLAGSERIKKTKAEGQRLKEGININSGLLALGNVISALGDTRRTNKPKHVPYRDSKLTRILQSSLGGNSRTLMIACISPADTNFEETLNTLKYAYRARNIMNKPVVNVDPVAKQMLMYKKQIQVLKEELLKCSCREIDIESLLQSSESIVTSPVNLHHEDKSSKFKDQSKSSSSTTTTIANNRQTSNNNNKKQSNISSEINNSNRNTKNDNSSSQNDEKVNFQLNMRISQLEFENNMLQEISNTITTKYKLLNSKHKLLEDAGYSYLNNYSPDNNSNSFYLDIFNQFNHILNPSSLQSIDLQQQDKNILTTTDENNDSSVTSTTTTNNTTTNNEDIEALETVNETLSDITFNISQKEEELELLSKTQQQYEQIKEQYDNRLKDLESQLESLKAEQDRQIELLEKEKSNSSYDDEKARLTNFYEKKITELRNQLDQHKRSTKDQQRLLELKNKSEEKVEGLMQDIKEMKRQKSEILKKMRDELKKRDTVKQSQAKELEQLKKEARKTEMLIGQLKNQSKKKDLLLQKKNDEAEVIKKKLKDIETHKQRVVQPITRARPVAAGTNNASIKPKAATIGASAHLHHNNPSTSSSSSSSSSSRLNNNSSTSTTQLKPRKSIYNEPNWREWLVTQIQNNQIKNQLTETLENDLKHKEMFVRESNDLKLLFGNGLKQMSKAEYTEQFSFLELNIKHQNEKISKTQKELAAISNDCLDTTEMMSKVSNTPYEKLPSLIKTSFDLCIEYAEELAKYQKQDQSLSTRTNTNTLREGIRIANEQKSMEINNSSPTTTVQQHPQIIQDNTDQQNSVNNINIKNRPPSPFLNGKPISTSMPTILETTPPLSPCNENNTENILKKLEEMEKIQLLVRQSSTIKEEDEFQTTSPPLISVSSSSITSNFSNTSSLLSSSSSSTTSSDSKDRVGKLFEEINSAKERSLKRNNARKGTNQSSSMSSLPTIPDSLLTKTTTSTSKQNSTPISASPLLLPKPQISTEDHSVFDKELLDMDLTKFTNNNSLKPPSGKSSPLTLSCDSVLIGSSSSSINSSNSSNNSSSDVFTRLSVPRPDSRLKKYRDNLKTDNYQSSVQSPPMRDPSNESTMRCNWTFNGHDGSVLGLAIDHQYPNTLYSCSQDSTIKVWDLNTGDNILDLTKDGHQGPVKSISIDPITQRLYSGGADRNLLVWDVRSGSVINRLKVTTDILCLSVTGNYVFGGGEQTVKVIDTRKMKAIKTPLSNPIHTGSVFAMAFTPKYFFTGSRDHTINVYNRDSLVMIEKLQPHHYDGVSCLCIHEDSLYSGSRESSIKRWEPITQQLVKTTSSSPNSSQNNNSTFQQSRIIKNAHSDWIDCLTSHNGIVYSGGKDSLIKGWDSQLNFNSLLIGHTSSVNTLVSNGKILLSGSLDKSIKLWRP
eukprot:gene10331-12684_t